MVDEALGAEAGEQPPGDALFEVELHPVVGEAARVLEDDRADGRGLPPLRQLLLALPGGAEGVERGFPARLAGEPGEGPEPLPLGIPGFPERVGAEDFQGTGERLAEGFGVEAGLPAGAVEQLAAPLVGVVELVLPAAGGGEFFLGEPPFRGVGRGLAGPDPVGKPVGVGVADAGPPEAALDVVPDDPGEAPEFVADRLGLPDENF